MKGSGLYVGLGVIAVAALVLAANLMGALNFPLLLETGCRILKPVWGYYKCEMSDVPVDINDYKEATWTNVYGTYYCTNLDIARNGYQADGSYKSCAVTITSPTAGQWVYKTCTGDSCGPYSSLQGGNYAPRTHYLDFGQYMVVSFQPPALGTSRFSINEQYFQKQLIYHDWFGYESEVKGPGCDIRSVLSASEWNRLPSDARLSLEIGQRQNFVVGWVDLAVIGNYYEHPTHGKVICTQDHSVYKVRPFTDANSEGEAGVYYDKAGNCYLIPEANPVERNVDCCPGETLQGFTCSSENEWVGLDQGECCRGGFCTALYCPGGGSDYCDLSAHRVHRYECRASDGQCVDVLDQYAQCCPPDSGCSGDQYCDAETYTCRKKPSGLIPCPFECCEQGIVDLNYYQKKSCAVGVTCCPGGVCKESCGNEPPAEDNYLWLLVPILAIILAVAGYLAAGPAGGVILGMIGGLAGYIIYFVSTLAWWAQALLFLGLAGFGAVGVWLLGGTIAAFITAIAVAVVASR